MELLCRRRVFGISRILEKQLIHNRNSCRLRRSRKSRIEHGRRPTMPVAVNQTTKETSTGSQYACFMNDSGWAFRPHKTRDTSLGAISRYGVDVILVEDMSSGMQSLKPITGDYGVIASLMCDADQWLLSHDQPAGGLNSGHDRWLEWQLACLENQMTPLEFFETTAAETVSLSIPGR